MIRWLNKRSVLVEKNIWRYKKLQGRLKPIRAQKAYEKKQKKWRPFFLFFGDSKTFVALPLAKNPGHAIGFIHIYYVTNSGSYNKF